MTINPYLYFNGEATEAVALYEKAFGRKAIVAKFKDAGKYDPSFVIPKGMDDCVMHANINIGGSAIMLCDTPEKNSAGDRVQLMVSLESAEAVEKVFDALKEGGTVTEEPQKVFWSERFASVRDKFGVNWLLSYENEAQKAQSYGE